MKVSPLVLGFFLIFNATHVLAAKPGSGGATTPSSITLSDLSCATDQIAKFDGTNWICSTDLQGPLPSNPAFNVVDDNGNGNVLGQVYQIAAPFDWKVAAMITIEGQQVAVEIKDGDFVNNGPLYYTNANCSGSTYLQASSRIAGILEQVSVHPGPGGSHVFYIVNSFTPNNPTIASVKLSDGSCSNTSDIYANYDNCMFLAEYVTYTDGSECQPYLDLYNEIHSGEKYPAIESSLNYVAPIKIMP